MGKKTLTHELMNQNCLFGNLTDSKPNPVLIDIVVYLTYGKIMLLFKAVCAWPLAMGGHSILQAHRPVRTSLSPRGQAQSVLGRERISLPIVTRRKGHLNSQSNLSF